MIRTLYEVAVYHSGGALHFGTPPLPVFLALRRTTPVLIETLGNPKVDHYIRQDAAFALGLFGMNDDDAFAALKRAARDDSHWVRDRTAVALRFFGSRATKPLQRLLRDGHAGVTAERSLQQLEAVARAAKRIAVKETAKTTTAKPTPAKRTTAQPTAAKRTPAKPAKRKR